MKEHQDLIRKIARLESINDQLSTELKLLDELARKLGFSDGLKTLKAAAIEILEEEEEEEEDISTEDGPNPPFLWY